MHLRLSQWGSLHQPLQGSLDLALRDLNQVNAWLGVHFKGHALGALHHVDLVVQELAPCQVKHFHVRLSRIQSVPFKLGNASNGRVGEQGQRFLVQVKPVHISHRALTSVQHGDGESVLDASKPPQGIQAQGEAVGV